MIFFTSDTHFYHNNIVDLCKRPIGGGWCNSKERVALMNQVLIDNWNSKIDYEDEVYHLGDFAFASGGMTRDIIKQLNGVKYLIRGNHDPRREDFWVEAGFSWVKDYYELQVHDKYQDKDGDWLQYHQPIVLCHYPIMSWNGMGHASWHLHGHCHGSIKDVGLRKDIGVDTNNLYPYSYEDIKNVLLLKTVIPVDYHGGIKNNNKY